MKQVIYLFIKNFLKFTAIFLIFNFLFVKIPVYQAVLICFVTSILNSYFVYVSTPPSPCHPLKVKDPSSAERHNP